MYDSQDALAKAMVLNTNVCQNEWTALIGIVCVYQVKYICYDPL